MPAETAPLRDAGYAKQSSGWWQVADIDETTPELQWPLSVQVFDAMRRQDAQVTSVLRAVTLPVRRTQWWIDPAGARPEVTQLVAEDLGLPVRGAEMPPRLRTRDRFSWTEHLREALLELAFGHMFFVQHARIDDSGFARLRKLLPLMPRTLKSINVADDGGLISVEQFQRGREPEDPIGVERLVGYVHEREGANWLGNSLLRPAYKNWLIKDRLLRVQAQTIERNGMGVPVYEGAETDRDLTEGRKLASSYRSGDTAGAAVPYGAKLRLLGVEGNLPDADRAIRYHDEQIARAVLAHFLNLGTQTGSWALGSTFADFFTLSLQTLAQQVADVANQHIVEDLVDWNWGETEPAPRLVFDEIGSRHDATAQAIEQLIRAGAVFPDRDLEEHLRTMYGLPSKAAFRNPTPAPQPNPSEQEAP